MKCPKCLAEAFPFRGTTYEEKFDIHSFECRKCGMNFWTDRPDDPEERTESTEE